MGAVLSTGWAGFPPIADHFPPTPEAYTSLLSAFQWFPVITIFQWVLSWHPAGKTSLQSSILNLPGRIAWCIMEIAGPVNLIYNLSIESPSFFDLPRPNQLVAALYCIHYFNRAIISPFFSAPSMSPIHVLLMLSAITFNWVNSSCIVGWLRGYSIPVPGFRTDGVASLASPLSGGSSSQLAATLPVVGSVLFFIGMAGNIYSETSLFRMRREEADKRLAKKTDSTPTSTDTSGPSKGNKFHKVYVIPPAKGVFASILYPHYVFEWVEWTGFALAGVAVYPLSGILSSIGSDAAATVSVAPPLRPAPWVTPFAWVTDRLGLPLPLPAVLFVINAIANMLPHARWGRRWYVEKFGEKGVAGRGAVVPGCAWM
ncbi:hypothetical protein N7492_005049 [Penicillium capsulatum]|uniref:Steroid 5-alpha reductase C-terminal domain-containing protein n=1 Tax=Penicillium capsulatum TaxID=69766 RepID=A0A9W9IBM2_9EURO|nr:hypothetical protein N7492_005049 [Penicillium capsulatum]KAJ6135843.1 hypothetical protein N7512_001003 [Penicillium capsulatum]